MKKIFLLAGLLIAAFYVGMKVQAFIYENTCLDLGGGKNPGNYPICVVGEIILLNKAVCNFRRHTDLFLIGQ